MAQKDARRDAGLLDYMPLSAGRVWQISGTESLARAYLARNPQAEYRQIRDPGAVRPGPAPDMIVSVGGREIRQFAGPLAPQGALVWDAPNAGYWRLAADSTPQARAALLGAGQAQRGGWEQALAQAGMRLQKMRFLPGPEPEADACTEWDSGQIPRPLALRIWRADRLILCAVPACDPRPTLRLHHVVKVPRFMAVRTEVPARALSAEATLRVTSSTTGAIPSGLPQDTPKLMILQRARFVNPQDAVDGVARLMAAGWVVVTEFDDDPDLVARVLKVPALQFTAQFQAAHAVQTSTAQLQDRLRHWNPEVGLLRNSVAALPPLRPRVPGPPRVFYGALNRGDFAAQVAASLRPAILRHPRTEFAVAHDRAFFDALPTRNKRFLGTLGYDDYLRGLALADVALAPLEGRAEELGKSDLKFVEAASVATLTLASAPVYAASIRHGETGLLAQALPDWPQLLSEALAAPDWLRSMALAARREVATSRLIAHQVAGLRDWYLDLWARRDALRAAALSRVPALAEALHRAGAKG